MLFFKRYLEKSQLTLENFESTKVPCYLKMRELPPPKKIDRMDDLAYATSVLYKQYIEEDWLIEEYFHNHDNDYLVSPKKNNVIYFKFKIKQRAQIV